MRIKNTNTILYCNRWKETVRFYRERIQLPVLLEKAWFVEFQLADTGCLSVADASQSTIVSSGGAGITLSWQVDNIDILRARMVSDGIAVTPIKKIWGAPTCFLFDPEGNRIELWA